MTITADIEAIGKKIYIFNYRDSRRLGKCVPEPTWTPHERLRLISFFGHVYNFKFLSNTIVTLALAR
jgi:hypothetical protein